MHQKDDAALKGKPFAIIQGKGNHAHVVMCSKEASIRNVVAGMKLTEAQAVCADLSWREYDQVLYRLAQKRLSRELIACSPRVSAEEPGVFFLDATGLHHLGGESKFCRIVQKVANQEGFVEAHVGVADSAFAATVASRFKRRRHYIVPRGDDASFLAPLPIKYLPVQHDIQESMLELGLRTMGQMTSLTANSLAERFGREGMIAYELAKGIDRRYPALPEMDKEFKCYVELGGPVELLNETQFVLKSMLDRITIQLKQEGFWADELSIAFFNDDEKFDERPIKLLRPSSHPKFLLEVLKLSLESTPLQREFTAVSLMVSRYSKENWEQTGIENVGEDKESLPPENAPILAGTPMSLTLMMQRFLTRLGDDAVVRSVPNDHYLPEKAGTWMPIANQSPVSQVLPVNINYINAHTGPSGLVCGLVLKKSHVPAPVLVDFQGDLPSAITYHGRWHRVKEITQPEKLSGLWWENPVRKSYYVALIEPIEDKVVGLRSRAQANNQTVVAPPPSTYLVLLVHDHDENIWSLEGFFD